MFLNHHKKILQNIDEHKFGNGVASTGSKIEIISTLVKVTSTVG